MHTYDIEVCKPGQTKRFNVTVKAKSRAIAAGMARKWGWEVCSVNMGG